MIANPKKFVLLHWRRDELSFMRDMADIYQIAERKRTPDDPHLKELKKLIMESGQRAKSLLERANQCPDRISLEEIRKDKEHNWEMLARFAREDDEYCKRHGVKHPWQRPDGTSPFDPVVHKGDISVAEGGSKI